ncbi:MAG TPA: apolipoprotein N-acyltransferase [Rhodocyclaceae bacterium]|nr:apolipoprotein N-acyltransferase [Rhodocyclaceae bacterium]
MMRWRQLLLVFVAGVSQVAAFAPLGWWPLGLFSLAVLFASWRDTTPREAAWRGFAWGLGCFAAGVSWVYVSMHDVGEMPAPIAVVLTLLFAAYLAIYPAFSAWLATRLRGGVFVAAAAWTLGEWLRGTIATGFPWLAVGYAQTNSPLAGYAPLLGVYGVSFAVAIIAAAAVHWWHMRCAWMLIFASSALLIGFGLRAVLWTQPIGAPFSVSLLQGNIPQALKWDPARLDLSLRAYADLAHAHPAQLLVLPETAIPLMFVDIDHDYLRSLTSGERNVLLGAAVGVMDGDHAGYANGAVMLTPQGLPDRAYFKHHLVPFGEFTPKGFQWFLDLMQIPMSGFTPGAETQKALSFDGQTLMPNICYEDLFGEEVIRGVPQSTVLVNLSNTAWFGHSLAQPQHLQISQMRAIETGRMMLRATNTGMTAAIAPDGKVLAALPAFTRDALTVEAQGYTGETPYVRIGNAGVLLLVFGVIAGAVYRRRQCLRKSP